MRIIWFRSFWWVLTWVVILTGCGNSGKSREDKLKDTIEKLRKKADFKPLNEQDAYAFINNYYLPRLDTLLTKRKIAIHPLIGTNFKERFEQVKAVIEAEFVGDTIGKQSPVVPAPPPLLKNDSAHQWDSKRLIKTQVITDTIKFHTTDHITEWHKKFGYGYMCISYPQYNANTKMLVLTEWLENFEWCGTGREKKLFYKKTPSGWEAQ